MAKGDDEPRLNIKEKRYYNVQGEPGDYSAQCPGCGRNFITDGTQTRVVSDVETHMIADDCGEPMLPAPVHTLTGKKGKK